MNEPEDFAVAAEFFNAAQKRTAAPRELQDRQDVEHIAKNLQIAVTSKNTFDHIQATDNASIHNGDIVAHNITNNYIYGAVCLQGNQTDERLAQVEIAIRTLSKELRQTRDTSLQQAGGQSGSASFTALVKTGKNEKEEISSLAWHMAELFFVATKQWIQAPIQDYITFETRLGDRNLRIWEATCATSAAPTFFRQWAVQESMVSRSDRPTSMCIRQKGTFRETIPQHAIYNFACKRAIDLSTMRILLEQWISEQAQDYKAANVSCTIRSSLVFPMKNNSECGYSIAGGGNHPAKFTDSSTSLGSRITRQLASKGHYPGSRMVRIQVLKGRCVGVIATLETTEGEYLKGGISGWIEELDDDVDEVE